MSKPFYIVKSGIILDVNSSYRDYGTFAPVPNFNTNNGIGGKLDITPDAWSYAYINPYMLTSWTGAGIYIARTRTDDPEFPFVALYPVGTFLHNELPTVDPSDATFSGSGYTSWIDDTDTQIITRLCHQRRSFFPLYRLLGANISGIWFRAIDTAQTLTIAVDNRDPRAYSYFIDRTTELTLQPDQWTDVAVGNFRLEIAENEGTVEVWSGHLVFDEPPENATGRILHGFHDAYAFTGNSDHLVWARAIGKPVNIVLDPYLP